MKLYVLACVYVGLLYAEKPTVQYQAEPESVRYIVQKQLKPMGLVGISQAQIDDHWKLYEGYVKQVNALNEELLLLRQTGQGASLNYADRRRRYGFEYNGMVLHEYYFGNMTPKKSVISESLKKEIEKFYGTYAAWEEDFKNAAKTRGIGWVILYRDPQSGQLVNVFVQDHEVNNIAGFQPLLVLDVWEHAYMVDHKSGGRMDYVDAFIKSINWDVVNKRFNDAVQGVQILRF